MILPLTNVYKRRDVFRCSQDAHRAFQGRVSVYHVLKEKGCYPQGCLYFVWHCVRMLKGRACVKGYTHTGRDCAGCTWFEEEKIHLQPECLLSAEAYSEFLEELERFESWLQSVRFRRVDVAGRIQAIKPWFEQSLTRGRGPFRWKGHLLIFKRGFFGMQPFEDTFYVRISQKMLVDLKLRPKMKLEFSGEIREDRGRIVVHRPGNMEMFSSGWGRPLLKEKALAAIQTAVLIEEQPDQCLTCPWGMLTDVTEDGPGPSARSRRLYCLKGISSPEGCYVRALARTRRKRRL